MFFNAAKKFITKPFAIIQVQKYCPYMKYSPNAHIDKNIMKKYIKLKRPQCKFPATYVWIDGTGENVRSKTRVLDYRPTCVEDFPNWAYDGSSTFQAEGRDSDITMKPVAMYKDPFFENGFLVLCDTYKSNGEPTDSNHRLCCMDALSQVVASKPWFGMEQEFTLLGTDYRPFGWTPSSFPRPQGPYYCGVGADKAYARELTDAHMLACLYMDLAMYGTNAEVMPSQWEYQIGPCEGIACADEMWIARYVLHRIGEEYGIVVSLDPKPMEGDWNGAGCHCNFSTVATRKEGGIKAIEEYIEKLKSKHARHISAYDPKKGEDNKRRLTGKHETANIKNFTAGVADRGASIRISSAIAQEKKGFLEDRRPASNCDPYSVINVIIRTCLLNQ